MIVGQVSSGKGRQVDGDAMSEVRRLTSRAWSIDASNLAKGCRVTVLTSAGPRLAGRHGIVLGNGNTKNQVRVLLDGSKGPLTLHARFLTELHA